MDQLKLRYFRQAAEIRFLRLRRTAFQDWFGTIMNMKHSDDYLRIRLSRGDGGLDGYRISTKTVFQVYAPREFSASEIVSKMTGDFATARETLGGRNLTMDEWVFVHNDPDDLPHEVVTAFARLQEEYNQLSDEKAGLLRLGRIRQGLIEDYLSGMPDADKPEAIAQAFRGRYATLHDSGITADRVFDGLWLFAGGEHFAAEPEKIAAVTAVLSYFFDRCDIFENVPETA